MIDLINKIVLHMCYRCGEDEYMRGIKHDCDDCILSEVIDEIKSINDRPHGEWINREYCQVDEDAYEVATCSNCKSEITIEYPHDNFCPNCGADMRGGDGE